MTRGRPKDANNNVAKHKEQIATSESKRNKIEIISLLLAKSHIFTYMIRMRYIIYYTTKDVNRAKRT